MENHTQNEEQHFKSEQESKISIESADVNSIDDGTINCQAIITMHQQKKADLVAKYIEICKYFLDQMELTIRNLKSTTLPILDAPIYAQIVSHLSYYELLDLTPKMNLLPVLQAQAQIDLDKLKISIWKENQWNCPIQHDPNGTPTCQGNLWSFEGLHNSLCINLRSLHAVPKFDIFFCVDIEFHRILSLGFVAIGFGHSDRFFWNVPIYHQVTCKALMNNGNSGRTLSSMKLIPDKSFTVGDRMTLAINLIKSIARIRRNGNLIEERKYSLPKKMAFPCISIEAINRDGHATVFESKFYVSNEG